MNIWNPSDLAMKNKYAWAVHTAKVRRDQEQPAPLFSTLVLTVLTGFVAFRPAACALPPASSSPWALTRGSSSGTTSRTSVMRDARWTRVREPGHAPRVGWFRLLPQADVAFLVAEVHAGGAWSVVMVDDTHFLSSGADRALRIASV